MKNIGILEVIGEELIPLSSIIESREKRGIKRQGKRTKVTNKSLEHYKEKHRDEEVQARVERYNKYAELLSYHYRAIDRLIKEMVEQ